MERPPFHHEELRQLSFTTDALGPRDVRELATELLEARECIRELEEHRAALRLALGSQADRMRQAAGVAATEVVFWRERCASMSERCGQLLQRATGAEAEVERLRGDVHQRLAAAERRIEKLERDSVPVVWSEPDGVDA